MHGLKMLFRRVPTQEMKSFTLFAKDGSKIIVEKGKVAQVQARKAPEVLKDSNKISTHLNSNNITIPNLYDDTTKKLSKGITLHKYNFEDNGYTFFVEKGKIIKITKGNDIYEGDKIVELFSSKKGGFKTSIENRIKNMENGSAKIDKLQNVRYEYHSDDGLIYSKWMDKNTERLTVPGELQTNMSKAEQDAWLHRNSETDNLVKELIANGRAENVARDSFSFKASNGDQFLFNKDGEIVAITLKKKPKTGNQTIKKGTDEFDSYLYNHKSAEEEAKKFYESGLASEGATFSISE